MFTGFHDQGGGFTIGLSGDVGQFICGQIGQVVTGADASCSLFGNQLGGQTFEVTQIL